MNRKRISHESQKSQKVESLAQSVHGLHRTGELAIERAKIRLAESIYEVMRHRDVSKAELSRRLGKSRAHVTQILRGDANFTLDTLVRISTALESRLEVEFVPDREPMRWDHLNRNIGMQVFYPRWGNSGDYSPSNLPQGLASPEAEIADAA